jgi:hypothetical protein
LNFYLRKFLLVFLKPTFLVLLLKFSLVFILFFIPTHDINAQPTEQVSKEECKVYEIFQYKITWQDDYTVDLPTEGDILSEELELVIGEVLKIDKSEKQATIDFRIFKAGEFQIPVQWKQEESTEVIQSKIKVNVLSTISESDSEGSSDYQEPISFGNFLWYRLIIIITFALILIYGIYTIYQKYQSRPLDAILEEVTIVPLDDILEAKFHKLIDQNNLTKKEFAYFMTELIQSKIPKADKQIIHTSKTENLKSQEIKLQDSNSKIITDSDLLEKIYKSYPISTDDLRKMKVFFLFAKYSNTNETISKDEAKSMYDEWQRIMHTIQHGKMDA